jgi:hypothetical protein
MAPHIAYEFARLDFAEGSGKFGERDETSGLIGEACLLHFRNVLMFFYGERKFKTDAIASDYFNRVSPWTPHQPSWLADNIARCNKLLAHLSYDRVEYKNNNLMDWKQFHDKVDHIRNEWKRFLDALPPERRAWFRRP